MAVFLAYLSVILIWATTPLAIKWSSDSLSFIAAASGRTLLALPLALALLWLFSWPFKLLPPLNLARHWKIYAAASLSIFPNMPIVYWAAKFIPSGLVAVLFSLSPFITGALSLLLLGENPFSRRRVLALVLALIGLAVIFAQQLQLDRAAALGVLGILASALLFSGSSVLVKKLAQDTQGEHPGAFHQATGSLLLALPGLVVTWWLMDGQIPATVSLKSGASLVYLAVIGSLLGAALFFYILKHLSASSVSLVTLVTPVLALILGAWVNAESLGSQVFGGVFLVLLALLIYIGLPLRSWLQQLDTRALNCLLRTGVGPSENLIRELEEVRRDTLRLK